MNPSPRTLRLFAGLLPAVFGVTASAHAQKTDVIKLVNGDEITGEIKGVSFGRLDYSTDDAGRLSIKWTKVLEVTSVNYFEVELSSGRKYFGQLRPGAADGQVVVELDRADTLAISRVVRIVPLNNRFLDRLKAYLDAGFSLAKANKATTLNVNTELACVPGTEVGHAAPGPHVFPEPGWCRSVDPKRRNAPAAALPPSRFLPRRWQAVGLVKLEQNDQLGLLLRATTGAAAAYTVKQTNRSALQLGAGVVVTRERFASSDTTAGATADTLQNNFEGLINASWTLFRLDSPKLDFSTSVYAYPSISTLGRVRGELTLRVKYEVFKDFYVGVNLTDNFDSKPVEATASKNDYVTSITVGWSYRR